MRKLSLGLAVPLILLVFSLSSCEKDESSNTITGDTTRPFLQVDDIRVLYYLDNPLTTSIIDAEKVYIEGVAYDETAMDSVHMSILDKGNGNIIWETTRNGSGTEIVFSEEWTGTSVGNYKLSIVATDLAGNIKVFETTITYVN